MKNAFKYSAMALGLAAAVYAANPVLEAQEGNTLLIDNFEDGDLISELGPWVSENDNGDGGLSTIDVNVGASEDEGHGKFLAMDYSLDKGDLTYDPQVMTFVTFDAEANSYDVRAANSSNTITRVLRTRFVYLAKLAWRLDTISMKIGII